MRDIGDGRRGRAFTCIPALSEREPGARAVTTMSTDHEATFREAVRGFIASSINIRNLNDDDNLFDSGIVNSLFAIQLMTFLEKTFSIEVAADDLDIENFKSISATTAFVSRKK